MAATGELLNDVTDIAHDVVTLGGIIPDWAVWGPATAYIHNNFVRPDLDYGASPTYGSNLVRNTVAEGIFISRCYGQCKLGGNKLRYNDPDATDLRIIVAHCLGPVGGVVSWEVNDIDWDDLDGSHTKTEYTGTRTQTVDARFSTDASAYRSMAYTAFTFEKDDQQIGYDPNVTVIIEGLLCDPLAGGAAAFTRNPAVILYDWYINVEGYSAGDLDVLAFQSLEEHCDEVPTDGTLPRYRFDYNFDTPASANEAKKLMWQSFNGSVIMSQGKFKPVWDSGQMADGAGSLTAKTVQFAFTEDNIIKGSFSRRQPERYNLVRVHFKDNAKNYDSTSVEERDESDIDENGEYPYEETCYFITDAEIARRRAKYLFNKFKYADYECSFRSFSPASKLEVYDLVTITHSLPGWTTKQFIVMSKSEDESGLCTFKCLAYYSGIYDDSEVGTQANNASNLPNPFATPEANTSVSLSLVSPGTGFDYDSVKVSVTKNAGDPFYAYSEVYISTNDSDYTYAGKTNSSGILVIQGMGMFYVPGDTVYIRTVVVNQNDIRSNFPAAAEDSIAITGSIRLGSFYAGLYDFWGGNSDIDNAATVIVIGNLDGTAEIKLGPSANAITFAGTQTGFIVDGAGNLRVGSATYGMSFNASTGVLQADKIKVGSVTYIDIDGGNARIRSSNYVSGTAGAGFTLEPDLLEVGNIAARGIIRTAVFQKDVVSAIGGNLLVRPADVLDADMTALDADTLIIEGNETFAVDDILRIKDGLDDEWMIVTNIAGAPEYVVTRDAGGDYGADNNPTWTKGATVVNYGPSGAGGVYMTSSETNAPYLSVITHAGSPWDTITTQLRVGNLNGYAGYSSDIYGFAAYKDASNYILIDPTNGVRLSGTITVDSIPDFAVKNEINNGDFLDWTAGTSVAPDSFTLYGSGASVARYDATKKIGSYCASLTRSGNDCALYQDIHAEKGVAYWQGKTVTLSVWVYCSVADRARISISDDSTTSASGFHDGDSTWQLLTATHTIDGAATYVRISVRVDDGNATALFDGVMCVEGDIPLPFADRNIGNGAGYHSRLTSSGLGIFSGTTQLANYGATVLIGQEAAGQDNIQITSGAINIRNNTTNIISITNAGVGTINLLAGSDIVLTGHDSNAAKITWDGSSYDVEMWANTNGSSFYLRPTVAGVTLKLGSAASANEFSNIDMYASSAFHLFLSISDEFSISNTAIMHTNSPDLGSATYPFTNVHADVYYANGGANAGVSTVFTADGSIVTVEGGLITSVA